MSSVGKLGTVFRALENSSRRQLLLAMSEENPPFDEEPNALDIVVPEDEPDVLEIKLVHHHLPMLEDQGYIEWGQEGYNVSKGPQWDEIEPVIELLHNHRDELPDGWV